MYNFYPEIIIKLHFTIRIGQKIVKFEYETSGNELKKKGATECFFVHVLCHKTCTFCSIHLLFSLYTRKNKMKFEIELFKINIHHFRKMSKLQDKTIWMTYFFLLRFI